jgi:hypothetical protein
MPIYFSTWCRSWVEELREAGFPVVTLARDCGVSLVQPVRGGVVLAPRGG